MISTSISNEDIHRFSHKAMATVFEIFLYEKNKSYAAQAATSAFMELDRLEQELSYFIENSDISRINHLSKNDMITIGEDAFECLKRCSKLYQQTKGAFDISMRPFLEFWKKYDESEAGLDETQLMQVMSEVGVPWLQINEEDFQVRLMNDSIKIDLGGFGKGYALEIMKQHLDDWDIESGFIHSGHSTVSLLGKKPDSFKWPLSISHPNNPDQTLKIVDLTHGALSGSGIKKGEHIIDPRSGKPATHHIATWVFAQEAGDADALSTAFMVMDQEEIDNYCMKYSVSALTIDNDEHYSLHYHGNWRDGS